MCTEPHPKCVSFDLTAVTGLVRYYAWHINCAAFKLLRTYDAQTHKSKEYLN